MNYGEFVDMAKASGEPEISPVKLTREQGRLLAIADVLDSIETVPKGVVMIVNNAADLFGSTSIRLDDLENERDAFGAQLCERVSGESRFDCYQRGSSGLPAYVQVLEKERSEFRRLRQDVSRMKVVAKAAQSGLAKKRITQEERKALAKELKELIENLEEATNQ